MEYNDFARRIDLLVNYLGYRNLTDFAESLGLTVTAVTNWKKRGLKKTSSTVAKLKLKFPQVNEDWLLTGEGEPIMKQIASPEVEMKTPAYNVDKIAESLNSSRVPYYNNKGVPYYNFDFQMGFDLMALDNRANADAIFDIEPYNNCTLWCNARGDSMHPTISSGDMVALKRIEDWSYLISGEIYAVITTNELRTIKRVKDKGETIILVPDNKDYEEQEIPKSAIMHIFLVKGAIKPF